MSRQRSSGNISTPGTVLWFKDGAPFDQWVTPKYQVENQCIDEVTPNYTARIKAGEVINNPCYIYTNKLSSTGGFSYTATALAYPYTTYTGSGDGSNTLLSYGNSLTVPERDATWAIEKAQLAAISSIADTPYGFAEDVGEFRDTLRLLRQPAQHLYAAATQFRRYYNYLKRVYLKLLDSPAQARARALAEAWLQYRFAIGPLVRSMYQLIQSLGEKQPDVQNGYRATARGYAEDDWDNTDSFDQYFGTGRYNSFSTSTFDKVQVRAYILYTEEHKGALWQFKYGLRGRDIPRTIWDLVPYSFMIDRVLDIGKSIKGLTNLASPNLSILAAGYTIKRQFEHNLLLTGQTQPGWNIHCSGDLVTLSHESYRRVLWTPDIFDLAPTFDSGGLIRDAKSIADLLSLIYVRLKV
jgi:hypothetical protein